MCVCMTVTNLMFSIYLLVSFSWGLQKRTNANVIHLCFQIVLCIFSKHDRTSDANVFLYKYETTKINRYILMPIMTEQRNTANVTIDNDVFCLLTLHRDANGSNVCLYTYTYRSTLALLVETCQACIMLSSTYLQTLTRSH